MHISVSLKRKARKVKTHSRKEFSKFQELLHVTRHPIVVRKIIRRCAKKRGCLKKAASVSNCFLFNLEDDDEGVDNARDPEQQGKNQADPEFSANA